MQSPLLIILLVCGLYLAFKNYANLKRIKQEKSYVALYSDMLKNEEGYDERINAYIAEGHNEEFTNKARIIQIYAALLHNREVADLIGNLDFYSLVYTKDGFDSRKVTMNSDSFIWMIMSMACASQLSMADVVEGLYSKMDKYSEDLDNFVEFQVSKAVYESLMEKNTNGLEFLKDLIAGEYDGYSYDKRLIGIFKRIAAAVLAYAREEIDDFCKDDLHAFAGTLLGEKLLNDLGIYDRFKPYTAEEVAEAGEEVSEGEETAAEESEETAEEKPAEEGSAE